MSQRQPTAAALWLGCQAAALLTLAACGSAPPAPSAPADRPYAPAAPEPESSQGSRPGARGTVAGRNERVLVYLPEHGDTLAAVAARFLGHAEDAWRIAEANDQRWQIEAPDSHAKAAPLIIPLQPAYPGGVVGDSYQTVPVLCYHRFGSGSSKMIVAPAQFEAQLQWLAHNHYRVLRLAELGGFLSGHDALPQRSVVLTFDDGYETVYRYAYPLLKKYGYTATLFIYTDFIGARDGLSWAQLQEMAESGVIDIQAHSKTHRNMVERAPGETDVSYRQNIEAEVRQPRAVLERHLAASGVKVRQFAFPFGDANDIVLSALQRSDYDLGVTVSPGGNAFFAHPLMLRRTMIFGDHTLEDFKARLQTRKNIARP